MNTLNPNIFMITDVTSRLGKALAIELAKTGGTVIIVAPDGEHGARVEREIWLATQSPNIDMQLGDIANLSSVRNLADIVNIKYSRLDVLINNSRVYTKRRTLTVDGFEAMFAANHLGPYLLTRLLLDRLAEGYSARILNITAPPTDPLDFEDLQQETRFSSIRALNASRMANLLFTFELARRMESTGVMVNALYPGLVRSQIYSDAPALTRFLAWLFALSPREAAQEIIRVATGPEFRYMQGKFLHRGEEIEPPAFALDPENQQKLWEMSSQLTHAYIQDPNYDPTGSVALYNNRDIPPGLIRPKDDPRQREDESVTDIY
jgi:NAD(P)-dependent dehydrogenase (short-subunit alcohol dehydrogenase family)